MPRCGAGRGLRIAVRCKAMKTERMCRECRHYRRINDSGGTCVLKGKQVSRREGACGHFEARKHRRPV